MRARENKKQSSQVNMPTHIPTHAIHPTFHLHEFREKALFLLIFPICIVHIGDSLEERRRGREGETIFFCEGSYHK